MRQQASRCHLDPAAAALIRLPIALINLPPPRPPISHSHQISLYAHITGLAFALDTIDKPLQRATISDPSGSHELRTISVDARGADAFATANEVWAML